MGKILSREALRAKSKTVTIIKKNKLDTHVIYFEGDITSKSVSDFIASVDPLKRLVDRIQIYFSSAGGETAAGSILIDYINNLCDVVQVEMIPGFQLFSMALDIFFLTNCKKRFICDTIGMCHSASNNLDYRDLSKQESFESIHIKQLEKYTLNYIKFIRDLNFLTNRELELIASGYDVYFDCKKIQKAYENYERLSNKEEWYFKLFLY